MPCGRWNQPVSQRAPLGVVVAIAGHRVGFASEDARRRLSRFFGRPRVAGKLPQPVCRWLAETRDAHQPLVVKKDEGRLIVRRVGIPTRDAIVLSLELVPKAARGAARRHRGLTSRENEVLHWTAQGKTTPEIAQILGLATGTVSKHIEHIFQKLGVETRTAAAGIYAGREGRRSLRTRAPAA